MSKLADKPVTKKEVERIIKKLVKTVLIELKNIVVTKSDLRAYEERSLAKLDRIEAHLIEIKAEMKSFRKMYGFWARHHLSPDVVEQFLREERKKFTPGKSKRVD